MIKLMMELGASLFYLGIILAAVAYSAFGIIPLALLGLVCSLYTTVKNK